MNTKHKEEPRIAGERRSGTDITGMGEEEERTYPNEKDEEELPEGFASWEEYEFVRGRLFLIIGPGDPRFNHFVKNKFCFERVKDSILVNMEVLGDGAFRATKAPGYLEPLNRALFISSVAAGGDIFPKGVTFEIGSNGGVVMGYLYVQNERDLPYLDKRIIQLRELGEGWFIYKYKLEE